MGLRDYFQVELKSGKKPNILDYVAAAVFGIVMVVFVMVPYMVLILLTVVAFSVWAWCVKIYFKVRGKQIPPTFS